jgi:hypothetical protein
VTRHFVRKFDTVQRGYSSSVGGRGPSDNTSNAVTSPRVKFVSATVNIVAKKIRDPSNDTQYTVLTLGVRHNGAMARPVRGLSS